MLSRRSLSARDLAAGLLAAALALGGGAAAASRDGGALHDRGSAGGGPVARRAAPPQDAGALHYRAAHPETDSTLWRFSVRAEAGTGGGPRVVWRSESGDGHREAYDLDPGGGVRRWRVVFPERDTDYTGERSGDTLRVRGRIAGRDVDRAFELDARPLVVNVAVGLAPWIRAGAPAPFGFWIFRPDDVSVLSMDARVEGVDTVRVAGGEREALRVRWAPTGWRGGFWSRRWWFRPSDGALVRTGEENGVVTALEGG